MRTADLEQLRELVRRSSQRVFPVVGPRGYEGLLEADSVDVDAVGLGSQAGTAAELVERDAPVLAATDGLEASLLSVAAAPARALAVLDGPDGGRALARRRGRAPHDATRPRREGPIEAGATTTTKTIYVPLDGSERAQTALGPASRRRPQRCRPRARRRAPGAMAARTHRARYLDAQVACLAAPARTWLVPEADPAAAVLLAAEAPGALVCMATHGRGALAGAVLGSVAEHVVRHSPTPVMLVGPEVDPAWRLEPAPVGARWASTGPIRRGEQRSRPVTSREPSVVGSTSSRWCDRAMSSLSVVPPIRMSRSSNRWRPSSAIAAYRRPTRSSDGFDAADTLVQAAAQAGAAIIAVGSHGRSGVSRAALGSVSMRTVRHAPCPVLVVGPECAAEG